MDYSDFDLEILPGNGDGVYAVSVVRSPAGEASEIMHFPFTKTEIKERLDTLQRALLHNQGKHRRILSQEEQNVRNFGQHLFEALFAGEIRSRYDVSLNTVTQEKKGLRLNLRIQVPELAALPWEYLYDERRRQYVCFSRETPIVHYLNLAQSIPSLKVSLPLRVLGMTASPTDQSTLNIEHEKELIHNALSNLEKRGLIEIDWVQGQTWRHLQRKLRADLDRPYHIFHFIGHGGFDSAADEGAIALVDENTGVTEMISATKLGTMLMNHTSLRLVILNACEGARGSEHDIFSSTASILAQQGIPAIAAMQYVITDEAAIELARTFYEAVADGMAVDEALTEARVAMSMRTLEWGVPVLYMRSHDGKLFDIPRAQTLQEEQRVSPSVVLAHAQTDLTSQAKSTTQFSDPTILQDVTGTTRRSVMVKLAGTAIGIVVLVGGGVTILANTLIQTPATSKIPNSDPGMKGKWVATGSILQGRFGFRATTLKNGKVLIEGGNNANGQFLTESELFDISTGTWTKTGRLNVRRFEHTATLLQDGRVLVIGGFADMPLASAELYDPASGTWTPSDSLGERRTRHTATLLKDGKVLVAGGWGRYGVPIESAEIYDPDAGRWSSAGKMVTTRSNHIAVLLADGKILVAGGAPENDKSTAKAELYDPTTNTWSATESLNMTRSSFTAVLLPSGKVLAIGGDTSNGPTASSELYDPVTGRWSLTGGMKHPRSGFDDKNALLFPDGRVLIAGGDSSKTNEISTSEIYMLDQGIWTALANIGQARYGGTTALLNDGRALIVGGRDDSPSGLTLSTAIYTPD